MNGRLLPIGPEWLLVASISGVAVFLDKREPASKSLIAWPFARVQLESNRANTGVQANLQQAP